MRPRLRRLRIITVAKRRAGARIIGNLRCFMTDPSFNDRNFDNESHPKTLTNGDSGITRRDFVQSVVGTGIALGAQAWAAETKSGEMIYRVLGRTGEKVSAIGLGGFHIGVPKDEEEGIRIIRGAIDRGINFMDNCWDYHDGDSEN